MCDAIVLICIVWDHHVITASQTPRTGSATSVILRRRVVYRTHSTFGSSGSRLERRCSVLLPLPISVIVIGSACSCRWERRGLRVTGLRSSLATIQNYPCQVRFTFGSCQTCHILDGLQGHLLLPIRNKSSIFSIDDHQADELQFNANSRTPWFTIGHLIL